MKRSVDRILTSHVGSLPRPKSLLELHAGGASQAEIDAALPAAVREVVRKQAEAGIDIVNDGEYGKPVGDPVDYTAWMGYMWDRLSGFEIRTFESNLDDFGGLDVRDYPGWYAEELQWHSDPDTTETMGVAVGEIAYIGHDLIARDIENLKRAASEVSVEECFVSAVSAGGSNFSLESGGFYETAEEESIATGRAMAEEYRAIADAGLIVQLDNPHFADSFTFNYSLDWDTKGFRKWAESRVEVINASLEGIPSEQVRLHMCWGSWKGPHTSDVPLKDVVDVLLKINADLISVEGANPRHEHEWKVWQDIDLPEGKIVMPGVVTHKTNIVEHPEVVADRIIRYAEAVGRENVIAGTDCGMGGRIHPELAWGKLRALAEGAELASKKLW